MTSSFWLILLAVLIYGLVHSILASQTFTTGARKVFGTPADHWYRLGYNFVAVATLLPVLVLPLVLSDKKIYTIPIPWVILSLAVQAIALAVLFISLRQTGLSSFLGLAQALNPGENAPPVLVTDGFYKYVRHPQYTAGLVLIWLTPVLTWNILAVLIGLTLYIFVGIKFEERKLVREFGGRYAEYIRRTPMLVPGLRFHRSNQKS